MRTASAQFKQALANNNRDYLLTADVTLANGQTLQFDRTKLWTDGYSAEDAVSDDDSFTAVGATVINAASITINNITGAYTDLDFTDASVVLSCGLVLAQGGSSRTETLRIGTYDVDETAYNGSTIRLDMLDRMAKFERPYSSSTLVYPATLGQIVRDACTRCGVLFDTESFPYENFVISTRPDDDAVTYREVIGWAAAIAGCFARCNPLGRLEFRWFDSSAKHDISALFSQDVSLDDTVITGVVVEATDPDSSEIKTYLSGSSGHVITVSRNGFVTPSNAQTIADMIRQTVIGLRFRKLSITTLTDPTREAGDTASVIDAKGNEYFCLITRCTFKPGGRDEVVSGSDTPARNSATRYASSTKSFVEARKLLKQEKTAREQQIEALAERIEASSGIYTTIDVQPDGSKIYYLHNQPDLSESSYIWKMTAEAWAVSSDGGKTWNAGMEVNGNVIANILSANGINASWIDTGALTITDSNGNVIFQASKDTHSVYMSERVQIGGDPQNTQTIGDAIDSATSFYLSLSNEHQSIETDSSGQYDVFPTCKTVAKVFYGSRDVSSACTYSVSATGLTGTWDETTRTYTVTDLTATSGHVDISATYNGATATKTFTVSIVRDGVDGADAAVLRIDSSRGNVFKNNSVSTVLTVSVYIGGERITNITALRARFGNSAHLQWYWQKVDETTFGVIVASDSKLSDNGFSLTLTPDEVDTKVTFMCELVV